MDEFAGENLTYLFGDFEVEAGRRVLRSRPSGAIVPLTSRAFDLLLLLVQRPNVLIGKDELISALWPDTVVEENNLEQAVFALRHALGERRGDYQFIKTIHRRGYQFTAKVVVAAKASPSAVADTPADLPSRRPARRRIAVFAAAGVIAAVVAIALTVQVLRDPLAHAPVNSTQPSPAGGVLAVRHFRSAADVEDGLLGETLTRLLEQRFSGITGLPVIAPESIASARQEGDSAEFGRRLFARYVLSGEVSRSGQQLELSATLTDVESGAVLWAQEFDRPVSDLTTIREEIVARSVDAMQVSAAVADEAVKAPIDLDAYEIYMRGDRLIRAGATAADAEKATVMFSRATVLDPRFARAYVGMAQSLLYAQYLKPRLADIPASDATDQARAAIDRALELNPALGEAWIDKARLITDAAESDRMFRRGLQLKPNYSVGSMFYSDFLMDQHRPGEAVDAIDRARRLDPMSATLLWLQAETLMVSRSDVAGSDRLLRQALGLEGGVGVAADALAGSLQVNHGQFAEALRLLQRPRPDANTRAQMAMVYLDMDELESADRIWKGAEPPPAFTLMVISQYRRDTRNAAQMARNMFDAGRVGLYDLAAQSIRDDAVASGDFAAALRTLEPVYEARPTYKTTATVDHGFSIVFAHVLILSGQVERGRTLARTQLDRLDADEVGRPPHWFSRERAQLFAMLGENDKAIEELTANQQLNQWSRWWYTAEVDPVFYRLRRDPRFSALVERSRTQRAAQRALLEEMRRNGEVL